MRAYPQKVKRKQQAGDKRLAGPGSSPGSGPSGGVLGGMLSQPGTHTCGTSLKMPESPSLFGAALSELLSLETSKKPNEMYRMMSLNQS